MYPIDKNLKFYFKYFFIYYAIFENVFSTMVSNSRFFFLFLAVD